jgi:hypothetical protein
MDTGNQLLTTNRKALTVNLDPLRYGTFAEIGAGQEVARHFFQAGGAAGTIAKSMSAYDMAFSDAIYGKSPRYVSRERLQTMLAYEYDLLHERLSAARGERTCFFVFADTVAARSYKSKQDGQGWMGIRFQSEPGGEPNEVIIHVRMWDKENVQQQQALGTIGVNLIYGAFNYVADPNRLIDSLMDNVGPERMEVDMIRVSGPAFAEADNRLLALRLVEKGQTNAVLFGPEGDVLMPSDVLYKKAILIERGSFRPVTLLNIDMLRCACAQFAQEPQVKGRPIVTLMELTMSTLLSGGSIDYRDFIERIDTLAATGHHVLISNYLEFYRLTAYFRRFTPEMIGMALGINNLLEIFNERYYDHLPGGILESFGRLFRNAVKLYVYPMRQDAYAHYVASSLGEEVAPAASSSGLASEFLITARNVQVPPRLRNLYAHLAENHYIESVTGYDESLLHIVAMDTLRRIQQGDPDWERDVPAPVAKLIRERGLFGAKR